MITFYSFILLQQWPCHLGTAHILCSVRGSACFMAMTETSGWFAWLQTSTSPAGSDLLVERHELNIQTCEYGRWLAAAEAATRGVKCCYDTDVNANSRRQMNGLTRNHCPIQR